MSQIIGLIEIGTETANSIGAVETFDDLTLDQLFARLVSANEDAELADACPLASNLAEPTSLVVSNLEALTTELQTTTQAVLANIFLTRGNRH